MRNETSRWVPPADEDSFSASLKTGFAAEYGHPAAGVWFAPGRANLNGEHIDFHGGRCLPMALAHGTYVAAAPRTDGLLRLRTLDPDLDTGVVEIPAARCGPLPQEPHRASAWARYVCGVLWALKQAENDDEEHMRRGMPAEIRVHKDFGADLLIASTLPIGAGLSSSASLECAAAMAFIALGSRLGEQNPEAELNTALTDTLRASVSQACIRAEVEVVGAGTGGLDQTTSMRGARDELLSLDCRDFSLTRIDMTALLRNHRFLAVDTGRSHRLADSEFGNRRAESEAAAALLGVDRLRDLLPGDAPAEEHRALQQQVLARFDQLTAADPMLGEYSASDCRARLQHALDEMIRSEKIHQLLTGPTDDQEALATQIGEQMTAGHLSMRDFAQVSFATADAVVETALKHQAAGARLIGGGFGGSVLLLAHQDAVEGLTEAISELSPEIRFVDVSPSPAAAPRF